MSFPAPEGMQIKGLAPCKGGLPSPSAILSVTEPAITLNGATLQLGAKIKINSKLSRAHIDSPGPLQSAILVIPPASSQLGRLVILKMNSNLC